MTSRRSEARKKRRGGERPADRTPAVSWSYRVGRLLQFLGLLILPFGIASELVGKVGLGQSLLIAGAGALVFYSGYVIQNRAISTRPTD